MSKTIFWECIFFIGVALAIALGFRQSAWEPSQGTALYLLHLPLSRRTIFLTKLVTGIGLLLACTLLPILIYAAWAATPGTHAGPFEWSMTGPAFRIWLLLPLAYLGAFASGIRPARWFGSRLLPLVGVAIPALYTYLLPFWWLIGFPLLSGDDGRARQRHFPGNRESRFLTGGQPLARPASRLGSCMRVIIGLSSSITDFQTPMSGRDDCQ